MKRTSIFGALAVTTLFVANSQALAVATEGQEKVTLTGCAVKGNGDGDGFLLANSVEQTTRTSPSATGSSVSSSTTSEMKPARILYWLDDDDDEVANLMGQLIAVTGEVEGAVKRGEIQVERVNGMIELEIKADGRKANVKLADVPSAIGTAGSVKDKEMELPYIVRKLDVKSARSIAPTCK
jgi:hypothetical protein